MAEEAIIPHVEIGYGPATAHLVDELGGESVGDDIVEDTGGRADFFVASGNGNDAGCFGAAVVEVFVAALPQGVVVGGANADDVVAVLARRSGRLERQCQWQVLCPLHRWGDEI